MRRAFTLIELLVVISIIALLIAILLPALGKARFSAKVTQCASYRQQLGVILLAYSVDNDGYLPAHTVANTAGNPASIAPETTDAFIDYGLSSPAVTFCPATPGAIEHANTFGPTVGADRPLDDMDDMKLYFTRGVYTYHITQFAYWVPRRMQNGTYYPTIDGTPDHPDGWPTDIEDRRALFQPILTDKIASPPSGGPDGIDAGQGGHRSSDETVSTTHLYADGRVEIVPRSDIAVRHGPGITPSGNWYFHY